MTTRSPLAEVAPAFVEMAHRIVWCTVATVDTSGRPRSRILHPFWTWDGEVLVGWVATGQTPVKAANLGAHPFASCNYWAPTHVTCVAECDTSWFVDDDTRTRIWELFKNAPAPVGYDPAMIPVWKDGPTSPAFAALRLDPWRLRVFPGSLLMGQGGEVLAWTRSGT
jgi:hypothetical protein